MDEKTFYNVAVAIFKGDSIFMSRRNVGPKYPKKWQIINGRMKMEELSQSSAIRLVERETGLVVGNHRLHYVQNITFDETHEFYYVYFIHLKDWEEIESFETTVRGEWKKFHIEKALVLDVVPGLRDILRRTHKTWQIVKNIAPSPVLELEDNNNPYSSD